MKQLREQTYQKIFPSPLSFSTSKVVSKTTWHYRNDPEVAGTSGCMHSQLTDFKYYLKLKNILKYKLVPQN